MAFIYITEFVTAGRYYGAAIPVADTGAWVENATSPLAISGVAANSTPFSANTALIRVNCDVVCSIFVSSDGTPATTRNARMSINQTEYFAVHPAQVLSVIANV